jgi:hypothetical protein
MTRGPGLLTAAVFSTVAFFLAAHVVVAQPITQEFRVNTATTGVQLNPSVAAISNVEYVVTWRDDDGDSYGVFGQRLKVNGQPSGPPFRVNTFTTGQQWLAKVGSDDAGNFVVAFLVDDSATGISWLGPARTATATA